MGPSRLLTQKPILPTPALWAWKSTNLIDAKYVANATKTSMAWNTIKTTPSSATRTCRKAKDRMAVLAVPMTQLYRPWGAWALIGKWICSGLSWVLFQSSDSNSTFRFVWVIRNMSQLEYVPLKFQPNVFYCKWAAQTCFTKSIERKIMHYNRSVLVEHIYLISYSLVSLPRFPSPRKKCFLLKSWASRLALLSPVGSEGAVSFLNFFFLFASAYAYMASRGVFPSCISVCFFLSCWISQNSS